MNARSLRVLRCCPLLSRLMLRSLEKRSSSSRSTPGPACLPRCSRRSASDLSVCACARSVVPVVALSRADQRPCNKTTSRIQPAASEHWHGWTHEERVALAPRLHICEVVPALVVAQMIGARYLGEPAASTLLRRLPPPLPLVPAWRDHIPPRRVSAHWLYTRTALPRWRRGRCQGRGHTHALGPVSGAVVGLSAQQVLPPRGRAARCACKRSAPYAHSPATAECAAGHATAALHGRPPPARAHGLPAAALQRPGVVVRLSHRSRFQRERCAALPLRYRTCWFGASAGFLCRRDAATRK
jgi:hypothetical protein